MIFFGELLIWQSGSSFYQHFQVLLLLSKSSKMTEYGSISGNFPVHESVFAYRQKNYVCGLINMALIMANVNQFKQMVSSTKCSTCNQYEVVFIVTFSITILLQLITIGVLILDTKLFGHSLEDFRRSAKHTTILLCLAVILVFIDLIAIIVTDDWKANKWKSSQIRQELYLLCFFQICEISRESIFNRAYRTSGIWDFSNTSNAFSWSINQFSTEVK